MNLSRVMTMLGGSATPVEAGPPRNSRTFKWAVIALIGACPVVTAMLVWVLVEVLHGAWPFKLEVVLKRLDIVGTAVIGLLAMLGVLVLAIVVAAIRANISGAIGLANFSITATGEDGTPAPVAQVTATVQAVPAASTGSEAG